MPDFVATHRITHEACRKMLDAGGTRRMARLMMSAAAP